MQSISKQSAEELKAFKLVLEFVNNMNEFFATSEKNSITHSINLYHRLINKMTFAEDELLKRHLSIFRDFCKRNREAIRNRDFSQLNTGSIDFTERIRIDMRYIFKQADKETTATIWEYILAISALLDPENNTKELLQDILSGNLPSEGGLAASFEENNLLNGLMNMLGNGDGEQGDTAALMKNIMQSNMFNTLMNSMTSSLQNGNLDLNQLMGSVQGMLKNIAADEMFGPVKSEPSLSSLPLPPTTPEEPVLEEVENSPLGVQTSQDIEVD